MFFTGFVFVFRICGTRYNNSVACTPFCYKSGQYKFVGLLVGFCLGVIAAVLGAKCAAVSSSLFVSDISLWTLINARVCVCVCVCVCVEVNLLQAAPVASTGRNAPTAWRWTKENCVRLNIPFHCILHYRDIPLSVACFFFPSFLGEVAGGEVTFCSYKNISSSSLETSWPGWREFPVFSVH